VDAGPQIDLDAIDLDSIDLSDRDFWVAAARGEVFADPQRLDLTRDPNPHVGFGSKGPHVCLGAYLARREITVAFRLLFDLLPDLEVAGESDRLRSSFVNGIKRLPARLGGAR
jgi:cytochrome P450